MSKNILLVTATFYPQNRISILRVGQWAKYWAMQGHTVTVLTTKKYSFLGPFDEEPPLHKNINVVEVPFLPNFMSTKAGNTSAKSDTPPNQNLEILKRYVRFGRKIIGSLFDIYDPWIAPATKKALDLCEDNRYDVIISSYSPPAAHVIAHKIKTKNPTMQWIADFRDLWAYNHIMPAKGPFALYEKRKEKRIISNADIIVTVSDPMSETMKEIYSDKDVVTIENGFDPKEFPLWKENIKKRKRVNDKIEITYTGTIYEGKQNPVPLFEACNQLIEEERLPKEFVSIDFYGNNKRELEDMIAKGNHNRHGIINMHGFVSRKESLSVQNSSDLLLFLEWNDPLAKGVLTGKMFEYTVSGTPILVVGAHTSGAAGTLIEQSGTGKRAVGTEEIKTIIRDIIKTKQISFYNPQINIIEKYRKDNQAKRLLEALDG